MKKALVISILIILVINTLQGQINKFGVPLIHNYPTQLAGGSEQNWCITSDRTGNIYFGSQDYGVIKYDGTRWSRITIKDNPRINALQSDENGIVYVGGAFEFGYLQPGSKGQTGYHSLSERLDTAAEVNLVYNIIAHGDSVLFMTPKFIYIYDSPADSLTKINLSESGLQEGLRMVKVNNNILITDNNKGMFKLSGGKVVSLPGGDFFRSKPCTVILPYDQTKVIVATFYNGLFLYDFVSGITEDTFIDSRINEKLKEAMVYSGTWISDDRFAIGTTQEQGVLVFDRSGKLVSQVDTRNSGLPELTITAMYCDHLHNSELWIASQGFISKVYFNLPFTQFSEKQGITAGINGICLFQGDIWLSTDAGILKSYRDDKNYISFRELPGAGTQVFPVKVIKASSGDFILAGSINGVLQISGNSVRKIEDGMLGRAGTAKGSYNARQILQSDNDPSVIYLGLVDKGIRIVRYSGGKWHYLGSISNIPGLINGMVEKRDRLWFITDDKNGLYNVSFGASDTILKQYGSDRGIHDNVHSITDIGGTLYVTSSTGILRYDETSDTFVHDDSLTGGISKDKTSNGLFPDEKRNLWYSGEEGRNVEMFFRKTPEGVVPYEGVLRILPNVPLMDLVFAGNEQIYVPKSKYLFIIDKNKLVPDSSKVKTAFVKITAGSDSTVLDGTFYVTSGNGKKVPVLSDPSASLPEFSYDMNDISFEWTTPHFTEELLTEYSYILDGYDREWSKPAGISYGNTLEAQYFKKEYTNLPFGRYTFRVRTRTLTGLTGNELAYEFIILKPWYATFGAMLGFIMTGILFILLIIKAYTRKLKHENIRLEGIVAERTAVVVKQKEELESSIHYASRIQMALLPSEAILAENIRNYFVLFKPRDIVSGDFYWMTKKKERLYIVAADCTGHGVPGAFMSLLGMSFLDEIIGKDRVLRADEILKELRIHVTESLKQVGDENEAKDGMDIALLVIDFNAGKIEFSGAYNPCFKVRKLTDSEMRSGISHDGNDGMMSNGKYLLDTIYSSKMPIGISSRMNEDFVFHEWTLEKGISYYLFSDGYIDQFGGPDGRKFMKKNFKKLLLDIQDLPMQKQKEILDNNLKDWMGQSPQIDDILVMGIRTE